MKPLSGYDQGDRFEILDLVADFRFKSSSSISFHLGTESDTLELDDGTIFHDTPVYHVIGSVDIHHPCDGHIKASFRFVLPERYHKFETMKEFVRLLLAKLQIPADETYEASFISLHMHTSIENAVDRDGMTDRIY